MDMRQAVDRIWRVGNIADRYERNIISRATQTKGYDKTIRQLGQARISGNREAERRAYEANAVVVNRAYSRRTYMGLSNG